jgi:hypothetical protein
MGMSNSPLNLGLRFLLELAALGLLGAWGWTAAQGALRPILALTVPLGAAVLWGTFRVPDDPGRAPVAIPGPARLLLEAAFFGCAALAAREAISATVGVGFALVVVAHYVLSYDRIASLLRR